jgi:hypothetical protein
MNIIAGPIPVEKENINTYSHHRTWHLYEQQQPQFHQQQTPTTPPPASNSS